MTHPFASQGRRRESFRQAPLSEDLFFRDLYRRIRAAILIAAQVIGDALRDRLARLRFVVAERRARVYLETVDAIIGSDLQIDTGESQAQTLGQVHTHLRQIIRQISRNQLSMIATLR